MKIKSLVALGTLSCISASSFAYPVPQNIRSIPEDIFTAPELVTLSDMRTQFELYGDSHNTKLIWYVPKNGKVGVDGASTGAPRVRFAASTITPTTGMFAGQVLTKLGGSFDTTGNAGAISRLATLFSSKGYQVTPAPSKSATTDFIVNTFLSVNGRPDIDCEADIIFGTQECYVWEDVETRDPFGNIIIERQKRSVDTVYQYVALAPSGNSSVSQSIPFQATLLPGADTLIQQKLDVGAQWDDLFTVATKWSVETRTPIAIGRMSIHWEKVFEQAEAYFSLHNNACIDIELRAFFRRITECGSGEACGIKVEFIQPNQTWGMTPPPGSEDWAAEVYKMVDEKIRPELVKQVNLLTEPVLGQVSTNRDSFFTLRANYQKLLVTKNEVQYLYWKGKDAVENPSTVMNVDCLKGTLNGVISWDTTQASCRQLLGL